MLFQFPPDCLMNFLKFFEDETGSIHFIWLIDISFKFLVTCNSSFIPILLVLYPCLHYLATCLLKELGFLSFRVTIVWILWASMQGSIVPYISCKIQGKSDSGSIFCWKSLIIGVFPLGGMWWLLSHFLWHKQTLVIVT